MRFGLMLINNVAQFKCLIAEFKSIGGLIIIAYLLYWFSATAQERSKDAAVHNVMKIT